MIPLIGLLLSAVSNALPSLFGFLAKKQDVTLDGFKTAAGIDKQAYQAFLDAQSQANALKAGANTWLGARVIAFTAGELSAVYYGSIILDSMFHLNWQIAKLPPPWDTACLSYLAAFMLVSPVAPVLSAASTWLTRRR